MRERSLQRSFLLLSLGLLLGFVPTFAYFSNSDTRGFLDLECEKRYPFTAHAHNCNEVDDSAERMKTLDGKFNEATERFVKDGKAARISVWVRDLETRQWAATNEFETYIPASLIKVPLMVAYFRFAEIEPGILQKPLTYHAEGPTPEFIQDFLPDTKLEAGKNYPVERLIEEMVVNSDNNAADVLAENIDPKFLNTTLIELGIKIPVDDRQIDFLTVKTYANIFRVLYNASYLNREYSEKALSLLSKVAFPGMKKPLPEGVVVAHKFGERELDRGDGSVYKRELHDCGIVYKGERRYSLCIMTEGTDFETLLSIIEDLSKITYDAM